MKMPHPALLGGGQAVNRKLGNFLLNARSDVVAAYSFRRLSPTYTGPLVRVRRTSDSAEIDVYAAASGWAQIQSALAWGSNSLTVSKWYYQMGTGRDLAQSTAAAQPACSILANGLPGMTFDGGNDFLATASFALAAPLSFNAVFRHVSFPQTTYESVFGGATSGNAQLAAHNGTSENLLYAGSSESPTSDHNVSMAMGVRGAVGGVFNGASSRLEVNATTVASFTGNPGSQGFVGGLRVGTDGTSAQFANVEVQELVIFNTAHSQALIQSDNATMRTAWRF